MKRPFWSGPRRSSPLMAPSVPLSQRISTRGSGSAYAGEVELEEGALRSRQRPSLTPCREGRAPCVPPDPPLRRARESCEGPAACCRALAPSPGLLPRTSLVAGLALLLGGVVVVAAGAVAAADARP